MTKQADLKELMQENFIKYASYVILERAIPNAIDGLKPVQRRILHTLYQIDDGRMHKVANVVGQTMALHPHGDAPIYDALVNLAMKDYLLDKQGNFGNLHTGDPAAAARYIETRLSGLARETLFNPALTEFVPSYDGRHQEPVTLPAKIPLLLLLGAEGIAVGMATRLLPHNFSEVLQAEIDLLEGRCVELFPDFPQGGIMDATHYDKGRGKVRLRARIEVKDDKTLVIRETCYSSTTESLMHSIEEAAKKGKLKIDAIGDYTAEKVEIEIKLPRGQHASSLIDALYAFTECEVTLHSMPLVIRGDLPWETDVSSILELHAEKLQEYLRRELEIEEGRLLEKIFEKTLEQIFIENRLYKRLETVSSQAAIHETVADSLVPYHKELSRTPTKEDIERLLAIPIRRISRFDIDKNQEEIAAILARLKEIAKDLKGIKQVTIRYLKSLLAKYGKHFPRRTEISAIETIDKRAMETYTMQVGIDEKGGFIGTKVQGERSLECTNFDKLLLLYKEGNFTVISIPEKLYVAGEGRTPVSIGVADKTTSFVAIYRDQATGLSYGKRFIVNQFILEKSYEFIPEGAELQLLKEGSAGTIYLDLEKKARQKEMRIPVVLDEIPLKGVKAKGVRLSTRPVRKILKGNIKEVEQLTLF